MFDGSDVPAPEAGTPPARRPGRFALSNWPVVGKVLAIALIPLLLAAVLGGLRVYAGVTAARDLRTAADRAALLPGIDGYLGALEEALVTHAAGGDMGPAMSAFDARHTALQQQLEASRPVSDVRLAVTTVLDNGKGLLGEVVGNEVDLRRQVTTYAPLLLTAETAVTGSVRVDDEQLRTEADGVSRAIGARGQMAMQRMLIERGGDLPEPELRASMTALAGTEPNTVTGMSALLGGVSDEASTLRSEMVKRLSLMSDPAVPLVGNPDLLASIATTDQIARQLISGTIPKILTTSNAEAEQQRNNAIRDAAAVLTAFLLALAVVALAARSLVKPLRRLRDGALRIAHEDLAREIDLARAGDVREPEPLPIHTTEEVGQVAHAVDELHAQALLLAGDEARLRVLVNDMFETMSRRNKTLVDQQLSLIEDLERNEEDPQRLDSLFRLDHLATRMRRNGANLLVLAGAQTFREPGDPVPLRALLDAAASEVEEYQRVELGVLADCSVISSAATDSVHLLAELIDNALRYSPPTEPVRVRAVHTGSGGVLVEVDDAGLGMADADLRIANIRLTAGGEVSPDSARHMGLFVAGRLARQHDMTVRLLRSDDGAGTTAQLYLPAELLEGVAAPHRPPPPEPEPLVAQRWDAAESEPAPEPVAAQPSPYASAVLPQRRPGFSGVTGRVAEIPFGGWESPSGPANGTWLEVPEVPVGPVTSPSDTSGFFSSRDRLQPEAEVVPEETAVQQVPEMATDDDDLIYQRMMSEWLVDPSELGAAQDWKSVWDNGWAAADAAENTPVHDRTDHGLPIRRPGARLVPGAGPAAAPVASGGRDHTEDRDPDAIRASISNHFGGVHAARSHARDTTRGREQ